MSTLHRYARMTQRPPVGYERLTLPWGAPRNPTAQQRRWQAVADAALSMGVPLIEVHYDRTMTERMGTLMGSLPAEAVVLLPGRTETAWWQTLGRISAAICLVSGRLAVGNHAGSAPFPSHAVYIGPRPHLFRQHFAPLGQCIGRVVLP